MIALPQFLLDSGASDHVIKGSNLYADFITLEYLIKIGIAKQLEFIYASKKRIVKLCGKSQAHFTLENVLYCQDVPHNLLSMKRMQDAGLTIEFNPGVLWSPRTEKLFWMVNIKIT